MGPRRRALLMPGSISTGHQTAAIACASTLEALGWTTQILDATWLLGQGARPAMQTTVRTMLAIPGLYDAFHFAALRTGSRVARQADAMMRSRLVPRLRDYLDRHPVELVISLSPTGASAVSAIAARYPSMRHIVFCTDASPHRLWIHQNVDLYLVTSMAAEPAVLRFAPEARVRVIEAPVRAEFYRAPTQRSARVGLGIPESGRCVMLMAGSRGQAPLAGIADALADAGVNVLSVAGYNARLEGKLRAVADCHSQVQVFGFTDRIPELMAAADLVITSPGATCMEARTVGRPLLLVDMIQGHGRDNLQHELELGNATVTSKHPADVVRSALAHLERIKPAPAGPTRSLADWEEEFHRTLDIVVPLPASPHAGNGGAVRLAEAVASAEREGVQGRGGRQGRLVLRADVGGRSHARRRPYRPQRVRPDGCRVARQVAGDTEPVLALGHPWVMEGPADPTRRAFIGTAAGAAVVAGAGAVAGAVTACSGPASAHPGARPARGMRRTADGENSLPGEPGWWIKHLGEPAAIQGYAGQASVRPGDPVTLYVSTTAREFRVTALRMGWYGGYLARQVWRSGWVRGHRQRRHEIIRRTRTVSCDWGPSLRIHTSDWPEGAYLLRLDASSGAQRYVPLTVRSVSTAGKVVLKNAVTTWQAYNTWGGYDLYTGPRGYGDRSLAVSLDRPYDGRGADLFLVFERKLINLAERLGLPLGYVTSLDLDSDPHLLHGAAALISPGHDEYWSPPERGHVTSARDAGTNVAFFGANAVFRRTRLERTRLGAGRLVVCYKTSYAQDPMYGKDNALVTSDWREPPHPEPESSLTGTLYESNPTTADYVVTSPDAWVFAGTGARLGTRIRGLVGDEYDRVNPGYLVPRPIQVLAHSPLTCRGVRSYADSAYYTHPGGAGVLNVGTMRWVQSLARPYGSELSPGSHRFTGRVTANVLRAFAEGPAAAGHQARDNLAASHEWPGDPIAAHHDLWPPVVR